MPPALMPCVPQLRRGHAGLGADTPPRVAAYSTVMSEKPCSPEFLARLIGGDVEWLEGDVQGAFAAADYEDNEDDGEGGSPPAPPRG